MATVWLPCVFADDILPLILSPNLVEEDSCMSCSTEIPTAVIHPAQVLPTESHPVVWRLYAYVSLTGHARIAADKASYTQVFSSPGSA